MLMQCLSRSCADRLFRVPFLLDDDAPSQHYLAVMNGPNDLILKRERHTRRMQLQALRRSQSVPEEHRRPDVLRSRLVVLRAHKDRLWAELEVHTNYAQAQILGPEKEIVEQCVDARKYEIAVVNRRMERYQKYLDILENREPDPSMNQIL